MTGRDKGAKYLLLLHIERHQMITPSDLKVLGDGCFHAGPTVLSLTGNTHEICFGEI